MKFQVVAEELVTIPAHTMEGEAVLEASKGLRDYVFRGESLGCGAATIDAGRHDNENRTAESSCMRPRSDVWKEKRRIGKREPIANKGMCPK